MVVGNPVCIVLICNVTGMVSSFVWKNISADDMNKPFASATSKDSARGSIHCTCSLLRIKLLVVWNCLVSTEFLVVESSLVVL